MADIDFYIGYDSSQPEAAGACRKSLIEWIPERHVHFIKLDELKKRGLYWRHHDGSESTEFAYSRFLTPYLSGYEGFSVFCDGDFLWRNDPMELLTKHAFLNIPCRVVQHDIKPEMLLETKMNGKQQAWYPKKNWSSLMLFDNRMCRALSPFTVNAKSASWLHQFEWFPGIVNTESLPTKFNYLVNYYNDVPDPVAVHFTDGGPWLPGYEDVPFADEWRDVQQRT